MATALDDLMQAAGNVNQSAAGLAAKRQADATANEKDILAYIDAVGRSSIAQRDMARETDAMAMALDASKAAILETRGGPARLQADLKKVMDQGAELEARTADLVRQRNRSIFDIVSDPVGTISDLLDVNGTEQKVQGAAANLQASRASLQATHQTVVESVTQLETTKPTVTAALAQARQEDMLQRAQAAIAQARIEGRKHGIDGYKAAVDANLTILQTAGTVRSAMQAEEVLRLQRAAAVAAAEERTIRQTMLQLQQKELKDKEAYKQFYKDTIIRGMSSVGLKAPEGAGMDVLMEQAMRDPNSDAAKAFARGMMQLQLPPDQGNRIAATAYDAQQTIKNSNVNLPPETQMVQSVLNRAEELLANDAKLQASIKAAGKNGAEVAATAYDGAIKQVLDMEFADVRTDVPSLANPFPNLSTYVMASPTLASLPITTKLLKPMIDQGVSLSNPGALMKAGLAAVESGTLTSGELIVGMNLIARGAMKQHIALARASDFGIIIPGGGENSLRVRLPVYRGPLGNSRLVNLASPTDMATYFAEQTPFKAFGDASQAVSTRRIKEDAAGSYLNNPNYGNPAGR